MNEKELTRERVRKHRRIHSALANVASCSHFLDEADDVTYNTNEFHGANRILQKKRIRDISSDSSTSDITEFSVQYYNVNTDISSDDNVNINISNDDWEHDNSINNDLDKSQNECEIEQLRKWAVMCNIPITHIDKLLLILRKRLLPQLPKNGVTFLNTMQVTYNIKIMKGVGDCVGEYVYLGVQNGLNRCIDPNVHKDDTIFLQINIDGASPYHSSTKQLWPILCKIIFYPDIYLPFPVALCYGDTKPGNVHEYMNDFIEEINLLQKDGICICNKKYTVQLKHIICDIPARKFVKQIKGHGGYAACERCEVYGNRIGFPNQRVVYPDVDSNKRTNQSFREEKQNEHHTGISPLLRIQPQIDLIYAFPIDYMHMCCLGIVKKFYVMDLIFNRTSVKLRSTLREKLFKRISLLKPFVPDEFQRKPRPFVPNLKASELRFIVLYAGPVIFKEILNPDLYDHFLLLHVALRILCTKVLAQQFNDIARSYLRKYFLLLPKFYGPESQVLNAQYLLHLADDVKLNHTLNDISAFPFESHLGQMRKLLRTANRPLAQICRRIHEKNIINQKAVIPPKFIIIKQKKISDNHQLLLKVQYQNFSITTKQPNDIFMLNDGTIIKILSLNLYCTSEDVEITGMHWMKKKPFFQYPTSSKDLHMWQMEEKLSEDIVTFKLKDIKLKMIQMRIPYEKNYLGHEKVFVIPLLHE